MCITMKKIFIIFFFILPFFSKAQTSVTASGFNSVGYYFLLNPNGTYSYNGTVNGKNSYVNNIYYNANGFSCSGQMYIQWSSANNSWQFNFSVNGSNYFCNYVNTNAAYHANMTDTGNIPPCTNWTGNGSLSGGCGTLTPPDPPVIASSQTVCADIGVSLTATGCVGTVNWSDGGIGTSRSNIIYGATTSLSATCSVGNLSSGVSNVIMITVNPSPNLVITNPATVAPPATVNITVPAVTVGSTLPSGTVLSYHTNMAGNITLPNPTTIAVSNTYYIKATSTAGCSDIKPVVVTINDCSTPLTLVSTADDYSSGVQLKKTNETINAKNKVTNTAQTTYRSNKSITLEAGTVGNPGFKANPTAGGYFKAEIGGCN